MPKWSVAADCGRRVFVNRTRRRVTITVTAGPRPAESIGANLTPAALRRLAMRALRIADAIAKEGP